MVRLSGFCTLLVLLASHPASAQAMDSYRSPVDVAIGPQAKWLLAANQTSGTLSLVDLSTGRVLDEIPVGARPSYVVLCADGQTALVSAADDGLLVKVQIDAGKLTKIADIDVGFDPHGVAVRKDGTRAFVALPSGHAVGVVDLVQNRLIEHSYPGPLPRYLTLSPDDSRLAVGLSGDGTIAVMETVGNSVLYATRIKGLNIGHMKTSADGKQVYFPWLHYGENIPSPSNIRRGWVLGNRLGRVDLTEDVLDEVLSLDTEGNAVADAFGLDLTPDESQVVISASGTHELLVLHLTDLKMYTIGSTEHIDQELLDDSARFARIPIGGRPMGLEITPDGESVYVANYLLDAVQEIDLATRTIKRTIPLGSPVEMTLARQGEALFYDGDKSFDRWYSCHSCHYDGGSNAEIFDTRNDRTVGTYKTAPVLWNVSQTQPWTWHGWQQDLRSAMQTSFTETMQGKRLEEHEIDALIAYFNQLKPPSNPHARDSSASPAVARGKAIFFSDKAACSSCHAGESMTDGQMHDVGTGHRRDRFDGYNTPSLLGVYSKVRLLHHGRARTLEDVLTEYHAPENVAGEKLTDQETRDLVEYLKTL
ncbi:c-type cytochrome [Blastopirellula sp. J2-11]|uniref:cytochrome c peroxidase n=1 Tax=Blastopirellula sp. J2-11 TaxID=2943192 RepID=UPI0021CA0683|nr:cytochrome c peroxidase [Blastopirellula sp. J2-11]UUO06387.1 c-type cytochrome [Blastopirellula sp. J2-11]